ncbi:MAG: YihY/virulence factor BrkB family protein [Desulfobacterales bacterium]|nr:MAG: YihY/virulence factor BrkB family protein [Desulfobacterales bacterium]
MKCTPQLTNLALPRPGRFILRVLGGFRRNQGLLLSGAVAYYTLLSIIPLFTLILIALSHVLAEERLYNIIVTQLNLLVPGYAEIIGAQVRGFLEGRGVVGIVGIMVMLFFSSMAFTVLENAMAVIFSHRARKHRRHFLISTIIPYAYILLLALGILLVTIIAGTLDALAKERIIIFAWSFSLAGASGLGLYVLGMLGMVLMLTSLYMVMPVGHITFRYALMGGLTASILWEISRHILVWYFSTLSLVNVIYGSLATAIVALLSIEIAAIILLFGAQVIAEFERGASDG